MTKSKPRLSCDHLKFIKSKLRLSCDHLEGFRMTKSKPRLSCDQAATELRPLVGAATELRPFDNMKISESKPRPSCDHLRFTESKPRRSCDRFALELRPFGRRDVAATIFFYMGKYHPECPFKVMVTPPPPPAVLDLNTPYKELCKSDKT